MSAVEHIQPQGEKVKKALHWIFETLQNYPEKNRKELLREAEIRFDLSPRDCEALDKKLAG